MDALDVGMELFGRHRTFPAQKIENGFGEGRVRRLSLEPHANEFVPCFCNSVLKLLPGCICS
jgi:hypothetical protein